MKLQQLTMIARLCFGMRYGALFLSPFCLTVFALCALLRNQGQHIPEAILLQSLALVYIWVVYLSNCLPWLKGARNNKSFRLIQSQKAICYWLAFLISLLVAGMTLSYLIPFGHPEIANAIFAVGISILSAGMNAKTAGGELKQICSSVFGLVMLLNLGFWFMNSPLPFSGWLIFLISIVLVFYLWFSYRNYLNWINRAGYSASSERIIGSDVPYIRRTDVQNK